MIEPVQLSALVILALATPAQSNTMASHTASQKYLSTRGGSYGVSVLSL